MPPSSARLSHRRWEFDPGWWAIVAFRRLGWSAAEYDRWSHSLLEEQLAFVLPTVYRGETITRLAIVNPRTTPADISTILDTMTL